MSRTETRRCQNCRISFEIDSSDFDFYEKINVPAPTFCPECRFQRRLMFRNATRLYKRKCDLCRKDMISNFSAKSPFKVYCNHCWWSDKWDGFQYRQDYDADKNFFEQFSELCKKVPYPNLFVNQPTMVASDYTNYSSSLKNCYMLFAAAHDENCFYSVTINNSRDSMDAYMLDEGELCYDNLNCVRVFETYFSEDCQDCYNVYFSKNLSGSSDCFASVNLKHKKFHIFNKPYSKEDYEKKLAGFKLSSYAELEKIKKISREFWSEFPQKFMHGWNNLNVDGDYIYHSKNVSAGYIVVGGENCKFCQFLELPAIKDCYDYTEWGDNAQRVYESITAGEGVDNIRFSYGAILSGTSDVEYSMFSGFCQHLFGCAGLLRKSYCILNKQYSKDDYQKLRVKIIEDMDKNPYIDSKGRIFKYGEFFPYNLSFFDYNESTARFFFPLKKEEVLERGWRWKEDEPKTYKISIAAQDLPDDIKDTGSRILKEIIGCRNCGRGFKIVSGELELLRRWSFALPRRCFECRHAERFGRANLPRFYRRRCAKCQKELITAFSPAKPDIIYCEHCYQQEVA
jgi:hypothetical protein